MEKKFKTIEEQIQILKDKGLIIEDEYETKEVLLRENYFFLNGYRHLFMISSKETCLFSSLVHACVFDSCISKLCAALSQFEDI